MEKGKTILLGITGGIAAYKMVETASRLTKMGFSVQVIMTEGGREFVTPLTFRSITHNPVETDLFSPPEHHDVKHVSLADRADLCLIAPATADFIGKMAAGIADNLLLTVVMATRAPVLLAPAMNVHMYENPIFQDRLNYLREKGYRIIEPAEGRLACGYEGKGRLPEPEELVEHIVREMTPDELAGKSILITAGPTREPLDPVRYLSNYSSGRMGYALARAAAYRGGEVTLISGPTELPAPPGVKLIRVNTALEMAGEVNRFFPEQEIVIMAAAVADYRPEKVSGDKIKKGSGEMEGVKLVRNPDILAGLGEKKRPGQVLVGFSLESRDLLDNSRKKLREKGLDLIIANRTEAMGNERNSVFILSPEGEEELPEMSKELLAERLLDRISLISI